VSLMGKRQNWGQFLQFTRKKILRLRTEDHSFSSQGRKFWEIMYYPRKKFFERVCTTWGMTNWQKARVQCKQAQKQENSEKQQQQQHFLRVQAMLFDTKETT
jgi:hypothetical protein